MTRTANKASSLILLLLLCACDNTLYHKFHNIEDGWSSSDTLTYTICDPLAGSHICDAYIELRTTADYPYRKLWLRAERENAHGSMRATDTICCEIFDSTGIHNGSTAGLLYQTRHRLPQIELNPTDTVTIEITHIMDGNVSGVRSVGVKAERCGRHLP